MEYRFDLRWPDQFTCPGSCGQCVSARRRTLLYDVSSPWKHGSLLGHSWQLICDIGFGPLAVVRREQPVSEERTTKRHGKADEC